MDLILHYSRSGISYRSRSKQLLKIMKLIAILLLAGALHASANGYSQITLSENNAQLQDVFLKIKQQTGYNFVSTSDALKNAGPVTVHVKNVSLKDALNACLKGKTLSYVIIGKTVVVKKAAPVFMHAGGGRMTSSAVQPPVEIKGRVTDARGNPLQNASILISGTNVGTATDSDGRFRITSPDDKNIILEVSRVGFEMKTVKVGEQTEVNIILTEIVSNLSDIVIIGYGTQKKVNLTGSVSVIKADDIAIRPVGQTSSALQGLAPGVTVTQRSGEPGGDAGNIRIRGIGTLGDANPLVLIDGVEGSINSVNPNMIESISVLKDAASASIYGSRAANGVILVTTKRAVANQFSIGYNTYVGIQKPTDLPKMVNALDHMLLLNEAYKNVGSTPIYTEAVLNSYREQGANGNSDEFPNTKWQEEVLTRSGIQQSHFVTLNGGSDKIKFLASAEYFDQDGIIENSDYKRFSLRNNVDITFSKKLTAKLDIQYLDAKKKEPGQGNGAVFHWMNRIPANQPGINADGSWGEGWNGDNPIAKAQDGGFRKNSLRSGKLNFSMNYRPAEWVEAELTVAPRYDEIVNKNFDREIQTYRADGSPSFLKPAKSNLEENSDRRVFNTLRGLVTLNKSFDEHSLKLLAGFSREDFHSDYIMASRLGFILPDYPVLAAGDAATQKASGSAAEWALQSFFGRLNYVFKNKYLFEANARYDGSSRFAKGNKYGFFPSVSAGWRISQENFMEPLVDVVTDLKIRGSWGKLGNQNIGYYPFTSSMAFGFTALGKQIVNTAARNYLANTDISWETTEMTNFGIDLTLLQNLSFTADYYFKQTRDILYVIDIPLIIGLRPSDQNVGVVNNEGWGIGINYQQSAKEFKYGIGFNLSDVKNTVVDLRGINRSALTVSREGSPINSIYGFEAQGFFTDDQDIANHAPQYGKLAPGDIKYKDQNNDGMITEDDKVIIGSTIPRYTYGATVNFSYKGFDLNALFQGVGKADGYLYGQGIMPFYTGGTVQEQHKDRWTPDNQDAAFPRLTFNEPNNEMASSFWMKSAAYLRLKNLQLGYSLPDEILQNAGIKRLYVFLNAQNVFTLDKFWTGYDVESPVGTGSSYPQQKLYSLGLNINF